MKIKSIIERKAGHSVNLGGQTYEFTPANNWTCEVKLKPHIGKLLSIPDGYEPADGDVDLPTNPAELVPDKVDLSSTPVIKAAPKKAVKSTPRVRRKPAEQS